MLRGKVVGAMWLFPNVIMTGRGQNRFVSFLG